MRDDSGVVVQKIAWLAVVASMVGCLPALRGDRVPPDEWPNYGNDAGGTRYSALAQIDRANVGRTRRFAIVTSRGVSTWLDADARDRACRRRIFMGTIDARLITLDAATGIPCADFGRGGQVDLTAGIDVSDDRCCYQVTSPPAVVHGLVVVGSSIGDNRAVELERGVVRAYDARNGALRWSWDPIPTRESDPARATWSGDSWRRTGAANVW